MCLVSVCIRRYPSHGFIKNMSAAPVMMSGYSFVAQELKVDKEKRRKEREESSSRGTTAGRDFINKGALR